ncbi:hypothetical protein [Paenibacillus alkalitolerans]|uniref:hypothetical protein n=1 Tax=Paenibacillus alkalitolerans TaxID=2799335 RepID=UPI0018F3CC26|nr:hypothetical protein [Paenibacillus alkalitolerans]
MSKLHELKKLILDGKALVNDGLKERLEKDELTESDLRFLNKIAFGMGLSFDENGTFAMTESPKVIDFPKPWEVIVFPWGSAVRNRTTDTWTNLFLPDGQELNVENIPVILHDNGIEFI